MVLEIFKAVGQSNQKRAHLFFRPGCREYQLPSWAVKRFGHPRIDKFESLGTYSSHDDVSTTTPGQRLFL